MAAIRFGIIGAGNVGVGTSRGDSFIRLMRNFEQTRVTAIYDIKPENAERAAGAANARAFTELEPFLESGVDAAIICSPVRFHAEQAAAALERGIHVLCEVTAAHSIEAARVLVQAAARSRAHYMLAENYRYLDEIELLKRMADDGRFGDIYFAEGEYLHDCRDLWLDEDGKPTWRGERGKTPGYGVYCTHSLGPLLYILDDRVDQVACLANDTSLLTAHRPGYFNFVMLMRTSRGRTVRVRVDTVSPRPHQAAYYSLQGTKGSYESWRGLSNEPKVWLADEHEPSHCCDSAKWHPLKDYEQQYIPERLAAGDEARAGGHGTSEFWMMRDFMSAISEDRPPPIDVYRALDYTLPGICAVESVERGGQAISVPDLRVPAT
jgi:predicted dehydrogenase